ncbi:MAG: Y-family DNA polymerase [Acidobacteria bacterium]|nr:Y-family DNA polymerase [Acidobacteriota bacterium]
MNAVALVDCNNFYVSCERAFDPKLRKRPVAVLSNNDGCVVARSEEVKAMGVRMGEPLFKVRRLLEASDAAIFSSNYELYADMSWRVMQTLEGFSRAVEIYSLDEAFLDLSSLSVRDLAGVCADARADVLKFTGIPVSVGVAPTKTLAKLASDRAKREPGGVVNLVGSTDLDALLEATPVRDVWGVGRKTEYKLGTYGITNARQLRDADPRWARKVLTVVGARIVEELRGHSCQRIELCPPARKAMCCSRTFGRKITELGELKESVGFFATRAAERMRRHKLTAKGVTVFIETNRFNETEAQYSNSATARLASYTGATHELLRVALRCCEEIYREGYGYYKAGVLLAPLAPVTPATARMFDAEEHDKARRVMRAVDAINDRWGQDAVRFAVSGYDREWEPVCEKRSPRFTTRWDELVIARCGEAMTTRKEKKADVELTQEAILAGYKKLFSGGKGVRRFSHSGLRYVKLSGDAVLVEQNPQKGSEWARLARAGHRVAWAMREGEYLARVVDGEVEMLGGRGAE